MKPLLPAALAALVGYGLGLATPATAETVAKTLSLSWAKQEVSGALATPLLGRDELVVAGPSQWRLRRSDGQKTTADCQVSAKSGAVSTLELRSPDGTYLVVSRPGAPQPSVTWIPESERAK